MTMIPMHHASACTTSGRGRAAEHEGPHRVDRRGDGLVLGEGLEPTGHRVERRRTPTTRTRRSRGTGTTPLAPLRGSRSRARRTRRPTTSANAKSRMIPPAASAASAFVCTRKPTSVPDRDHQDHDPDAAHQVRDRPSREHGRPGHRQRPETVDDAALQVRGHPDRGGHRAERHGLDEDARHQEVHVRLAGHA